jgi:predicted kinase
LSHFRAHIGAPATNIAPLIFRSRTEMKLIVLQGLPASGKSTYRKQLMAVNRNLRYVNKDELRAKYPDENEEKIHKRHQALIEEYLNAGHDIVVDNTNFNQRTLNEYKTLAQRFGAESEFVPFETTWQECVRRDDLRKAGGERYVGRSVIVSFAMRYGLYKEPVQKAVIFDIDGTLAKIDHRRHFVQSEKKNWKAFFEALSEDEVNVPVKQLYDLARGNYTLILCSGRPDNYRLQTELWLEKHGIDDYFALFMRAQGDKRQDYETKKDLYFKFIKPYFEVQWSVDDRAQVVQLWRSLGITCFQCDEGNF